MGLDQASNLQKGAEECWCQLSQFLLPSVAASITWLDSYGLLYELFNNSLASDVFP